MAPNRSKASDGTIGDEEHALRESAHNPESPPPAGNPDDQVDAADITHDPGHGADMGQVTEAVRLSKDRRIRLVIFNRRIFSSYDHSEGPAWTWRPYYGDNPHDKHAHFEVNDLHHDETQPWSITMATIPMRTDPDFHALISRVNALIDMALVNPKGDDLKPEANRLAEALNRVESKLDGLDAKLNLLLAREPGAPGQVPVTVGTFTGTVTYGGA